MQKVLSLLEKPQPEAIVDERKLKYFISKAPVTIWDYFSFTEQAYESSSVEEKLSMLNRYYKALYEKYCGSGNFYLFVSLSGRLFSAIFCLIL